MARYWDNHDAANLFIVCDDMIKIRLSNDLKVIRRLERQTFPHDDPCDLEECYWWIGYDKTVPVCFAGLHYYDLSTPTAFLYRVGVIKKYRGHGLQRRLIRVREQRCRKDKVYRIITYIHPKSISSGNNLIRCGYSLYLPSHYWGLTNGIYFYKTLND